ncbi:hypothetical protein GCM10028818_10530 [Spirosoma horti]
MGKYVLILFLWVWLPTILLAQQPVHTNPTLPLCATFDLTAAQRKELNLQASQALAQKRASNAAFASITYVPIRPHILRRSDGTGGMSMASLNQVIAVTNSYYLLNGYGIQFYFCGTSPDYINNDTQYNSFDINNESAITQGHDVTNAMNQYYVNSFASGAGGYAYYPANGLYSTHSFILNEAGGEDDMGNRLIPHELGHNFNLVHTFGERAGNGTLGSGTTFELVTRGPGANCTIEGDYICDTPADPYNVNGANITYVNNCPQYDPSSTARDANGQAYDPSISNIMSYYFPCTHDFTAGQYERMQAGLALRQTHTAYSLDCPPTAVSAPTNLVVSISNGNVLLTWQDNGTNEMGYFIERSRSPTSGFLPVGGVGPNTTTFTDTKTAPVITYYYRVKPSNSTTTGISQVSSIQTPACRPSITYACDYPVGFSSMTVNNVPLSQNSGCSPNGYGTFGTSTTVLAGMSYPISGTFLYSFYDQGVTIWADLNRDGTFDASQGERLFQTSAYVTGQFTGSLTLPASLSAGALSIRAITAYSTIPNIPCGTYSYGEAEDYTLNVVSPTPPSADLSLSLQSSSRTLATNQLVSYSLTIRNAGPDDATGISWQNRLPANMSFFSGDANVVNSGTAVSGSNLSLANGQSATFAYHLFPTRGGTFVNAAQIMTSSLPDPDSQPGSGTGDGQDDAASVDIRTAASTSTVYSSPNPNQVPLPAVASSQPAPDPDKADLSLAMAVDLRTPIAGQSVTFTVSIRNEGGLSATNIVVRDTLRGLTLTGSSPVFSVVSTGAGYTIIEGTVASLAANATTQVVFRALTSATGYITNVAQIWSSTVADPDSKPGSSTPTANNVNGEDDIAWIDLRVGLP